jgi:hypothetical protein
MKILLLILLFSTLSCSHPTKYRTGVATVQSLYETGKNYVMVVKPIDNSDTLHIAIDNTSYHAILKGDTLEYTTIVK